MLPTVVYWHSMPYRPKKIKRTPRSVNSHEMVEELARKAALMRKEAVALIQAADKLHRRAKNILQHAIDESTRRKRV